MVVVAVIDSEEAAGSFETSKGESYGKAKER